MSFNPNSPNTIKSMLKILDQDSFKSLFNFIPKNILLNKNFNIGIPLSELEMTNKIKDINNDNKVNDMICFNGKGIYDHFVPSIIDFISMRSEYYTAYTPYQPEVSQGTLQCLYEYQTMICELSKMDISNASIYDGASALYEACILTYNYNKKNIILISESVYDNYFNVIKTLKENLNLNFKIIPLKNGKTNLSKINSFDNISCIIIQSPNKYGILESWKNAYKLIKKSNTILIAISNPIMLSKIEPPGNCGAEIFISDGQCLGNYMNYGGPTLGIMSVKNKFMRKIPGRIIGRTLDKKGKEGFVLTLQTREQHIRRENATSNICTNQSLLALRALFYLSSIGKKGIEKIADLCISKTQYLINEIEKIDGFQIPFKNNIIFEFLVKTNYNVDKIIDSAIINKIYLNKSIYNKKKYIQIAVTEKRTKEELDKLIKFFKNFNE